MQRSVAGHSPMKAGSHASLYIGFMLSINEDRHKSTQNECSDGNNPHSIPKQNLGGACKDNPVSKLHT